MERKNKITFNSNGFLLIEALVSVAITGIILLGIISMMDVVNFSGSRISATISRNELINRIRMNAAHLTSIEASADLTESLGTSGLTPDIGSANNLTNYMKLKNCLPKFTSASAGCSKLSMDDARGFRFYLAEGNSTDPLKALAGEDVFFTMSGVRCDQTAAAQANQCPITARIWAEPFCLNFANSCNKAMSLTIRYHISLRSDYTGKVIFPAIESEVYLPLSKGIQMTSLWDQNNVAISKNSADIHVLEKYIAASQSITGIRFVTTLGNPSGLSSMRLQVRTLTGTEATGILETSIPSALLSKTWQNVPDPLNAGQNWSISLVGAKLNQEIVFGNHLSATSTSGGNKEFKIGDLTSGAYRWTVDVANNPVAPTFKSGFYQFRAVATDTLGGEIESTNYTTIRIMPKVQIVPVTGPGNSLVRNCTSSDSVDYSYLIADDEGLSTQTVKIDSVDVSFTSATGTHGIISFPFSLSQDIGEVPSKSFNLQITATNLFLGHTATASGATPMTATTLPYGITLNQYDSTPNPTLTSNPNPVRIGNNTVATTSFTTGSCCDVVPSINWSFPIAGGMTQPMLSLVSSTTPTCTLNNATNTRTCDATATASGILDGPSTGSPNIQADYSFASKQNACTMTSVGTKTVSTYVQVLKLPSIKFYLTESLWLTLPSGPVSPPELPAGIKSFTPKAYVRIDFDPEEAVTVTVNKSTDNSVVCTITFSAGSTMTPTDRECLIPANYSGDLILQRSSSNVKTAADLPNSIFKAELATTGTTHRTCQANIQSHPDYSNFSVPTTIDMINSPFGDTENSGFNDAGHWLSGSNKSLRCYDSWRTPNNGSNTINFINDNDYFNKQDIYETYRFNNEIRVSGQQYIHRRYRWYYTSPSYTTPVSDGNTKFERYTFPTNGGSLDINSQPNTPSIFIVTRNGNPVNGTFASYTLTSPGNEANLTCQPRAWDDLTNTLCPITLSTMKIKRLKAAGCNIPGAGNVFSNNHFATSMDNGEYSYTFMCSFGRWNPAGKNKTNWID